MTGIWEYIVETRRTTSLHDINPQASKSLLTTPERLIGREACLTDHTPEDSYQRMVEHLARLLPNATEKQIKKLLK